MTLTDEDVDALRARLDAEPEPPDADWLGRIREAAIRKATATP